MITDKNKTLAVIEVHSTDDNIPSDLSKVENIVLNGKKYDVQVHTDMVALDVTSHHQYISCKLEFLLAGPKFKKLDVKPKHLPSSKYIPWGQSLPIDHSAMDFSKLEEKVISHLMEKKADNFAQMYGQPIQIYSPVEVQEGKPTVGAVWINETKIVNDDGSPVDPFPFATAPVNPALAMAHITGEPVDEAAFKYCEELVPDEAADYEATHEAWGCTHCEVQWHLPNGSPKLICFECGSVEHVTALDEDQASEYQYVSPYVEGQLKEIALKKLAGKYNMNDAMVSGMAYVSKKISDELLINPNNELVWNPATGKVGMFGKIHGQKVYLKDYDLEKVTAANYEGPAKQPRRIFIEISGSVGVGKTFLGLVLTKALHYIGWTVHFNANGGAKVKPEDYVGHGDLVVITERDYDCTWGDWQRQFVKDWNKNYQHSMGKATIASIGQTSGWDCWRSYFEDGYAPAEAIAADFNAGADDESSID